jgi:hypothetical protein
VSANGNLPEKPQRHGFSGLYIKAQAGLKLRDKRVERLARKVRGLCHWLEPSDYPMVRAWSEMETLAGQAYAVLRGLGMLTSDGEGKRLLHDYRLLRQTQAMLARELGMTPAARTAIGASGKRATFDLAAAMAATDIEDVPEGGEKPQRAEAGARRGAS